MGFALIRARTGWEMRAGPITVKPEYKGFTELKDRI
jgi:hypothetical protein